MDNILVIDKPKGWTSNDVVQKIKHYFKYKKVGHAGTLDPNATGVLIIGINEGTKLLGSLSLHDKEYIADIKFGIQTDTDDILGKVIKETDAKDVNLFSINKFIENIMKNGYLQTPPNYSARKVNGKKLYEYARKNKEVEIKPNDVKIFKYEILSFKDNILKIKLLVSKGFYIRSFARDLGIALNSSATLVDLRRTKSGNFTIEEAKTLKQLLS